jgi:hypothetical protein
MLKLFQWVEAKVKVREWAVFEVAGVEIIEPSEIRCGVELTTRSSEYKVSVCSTRDQWKNKRLTGIQGSHQTGTRPK